MVALLQTFLKEITDRLKEAGIDTPRLDSRILIAHVLKIDDHEVLFANRELSFLEQEEILSLVEERLANRPICKIIGKKDFYKNSFFVNEDVLSPRPDTEILVEAVINSEHSKNSTNIVDLGPGSGCILLSILDELPHLSGVGIDVSQKALKVAERNTQALGLADRCQLLCASWFDDLPAILGGEFDIIVSNPPYIPQADISGLSKEVKEHDPLDALTDGKDGLSHYRQIAQVAAVLLKQDGEIYLEVGIGQAANVQEIFEQCGFKHLATLKDLGGVDRCIRLKK